MVALSDDRHLGALQQILHCMRVPIFSCTVPAVHDFRMDDPLNQIGREVSILT